MGMDPFSAIGLAGNIVAFLDVGHKLLKGANNIHSAASGATADNESLASMALRLNATLPELQSRTCSMPPHSEHEKALVELAEECNDTSDALLELLAELRFECIDRLNQLVEYGESTQAELASIGDNMKVLQTGLETSIVSTQAKQSVRHVLSLSTHATSKAHQETFDWILEDGEDIDHDSKVMEARDDFIKWLMSGSGIFHISGKPGAGKSTLLKYVYRHKKTREHLKIWSHAKKLVLGSFFFWNPGSDFQKKLKGLVRGILHSLLSDSPDLIPMVFPDQWAATATLPSITFDYHEEIEECLKRLITLDKAYIEHKFAVFVDGLDEFEGNHSEMINLLLDWAASQPQDVKICVSSREWNVFRDAFQNSPKLRLQDVTRSDMATLVRDRLDSNKTFSALGSETLRCGFQDQIVDKAEGVFLWVALVLRDVEEGLLAGDSLAQLVARVDSLLTELEDLFLHLFNSIHRVDREVYAILTVAVHTQSEEWPLFRFSLLEEYLADSQFAMKWPMERIPDSFVGERLERVQRKIYGKAKGLLEVSKTKDPTRASMNGAERTVRLIHRAIGWHPN
ncbi:hypothetical protein B0T16DRAFT_460440 [Cercophora newfieldiana]|uniref:Nephrocystin 3-like N-terminal domain-containing protein n=1 Tax=Cercophora newfieldiana TaxID=92897 RepID=A0AA40CP12_9PEZI|nr:hypothetical protein B0T16DRAFT_460440 [Cercophora newfieldiana]